MRIAVCAALLSITAGTATSAGKHRPFTLSPSMIEMCAQQSGIMMCQQVEEFLAAMSAELRDDAWAKSMESRLRTAYEVGGKGLAQIRALECRKNRCAIEYAINLQAAGPDFEMDGFRFPEGLEPGTGALTYELNPRTVVTVLCLTRSGS